MLPRVYKCFVLLIELLVLFLILNCVLIILDVPKMDRYHSDIVRKSRFESQYNISRGEGYSRYYVNSYGLIGKEPAPIDEKKVLRIAVFGDSLVEALQVMPEKHFATILEKTLESEFGFCNVEVWNFGYQGDNTTYSYQRWQAIAKTIPFETVMFFVNEGDIFEITDLNTKTPGNLIFSNNAPYNYFWYKKNFQRLIFFSFYLKERIVSYFSESSKKYTEFVNFKALQKISLREDSSIDLSLINKQLTQLEHVKKSIQNQGSLYYTVGIPTARSAPENYVTPHEANRYLIYQRFKNSALPLDLNFIDTSDSLFSAINLGTDPYSDWEAGGHLNNLGHFLVATNIKNKIASQLYSSFPLKRCQDAVQ